MSWCALTNLTDGRSMSWRTIGDPADATKDEVVVPHEHLVGVTDPVWDADLQRPVSLEQWRASRRGVPRGTGEPVFAPHLLGGTLREPPNSIGSFAARLSHELPFPSDDWMKIPFDEVLWDTAGWFDPQHGALVVERPMVGDFSGGGMIVIPYAAGTVRLDFALYKNGLPEVVIEGGGSGPTEDRFRGGLSATGRSFRAPKPVSGRTGDVFEIYVRQDVGAEVLLSSADPHLPDDVESSEPNAIYFMGIYVTH